MTDNHLTEDLIEFGRARLAELLTPDLPTGELLRRVSALDVAIGDIVGSIPAPPKPRKLRSVPVDERMQVEAFWADVERKLVWDLVPYQFLYDLYQGWSRSNDLAADIGRNQFGSVVYAVVRSRGAAGLFDAGDPATRYRPLDRMSRREPLIWAYGIGAGWPRSGSKFAYRGFVRRSATTTEGDAA
jgi:hypothetical protein